MPLTPMAKWLVPLLLFGCGANQTTTPSSPSFTQQHLSKEERTLAAELFKICQTCHGSYAQKRALGFSEVIGTWSKEAIKEALLAYKLEKRDRTGNGYIMQGEMRFVTIEEIELLAHYIPSLYKEQK